MSRIALMIVPLLAIACSSAQQVDDGVYCVEPRPEFCTRDYRPVCGRRASSDDAESVKTYGNGCDACSDSRIISYRLGACDGDVK